MSRRALVSPRKNVSGAKTTEIHLAVGAAGAGRVIKLPPVRLSAGRSADVLSWLGNPNSRKKLAQSLGRVLNEYVEAEVPQNHVRDSATAIYLRDAYRRGDQAKAQVVRRDDMLTGERFAERLGMSRATVANRRTRNKLLALELGAKRGFRYPAWQADLITDARCRARFEATLLVLKEVDGWSQYRFFVTASPMLAGSTPIQALLKGTEAEVRKAAAAWASGEQGGG